MKEINKNFVLDINATGVKKPVLWFDNCCLSIGKDGTCIKSVFQEEMALLRRLENEYLCLVKLKDTKFAPKLIAFDKEDGSIRMEYIRGLTLTEYVTKFKKIPENFCKQLVSALLIMADLGIEYEDMKEEHIILEGDNANLRIIDYGVCRILKNINQIKQIKEEIYSEYSFVFKDSKNDISSKLQFKEALFLEGIDSNSIEQFFNNMELI